MEGNPGGGCNSCFKPVLQTYPVHSFDIVYNGEKFCDSVGNGRT